MRSPLVKNHKPHPQISRSFFRSEERKGVYNSDIFILHIYTKVIIYIEIEDSAVHDQKFLFDFANVAYK